MVSKLHHDGPTELRATLDAWAKAAGFPAMPFTDDGGSTNDRPAIPLDVRHLGWRNAKCVGRGGEGLTVLNDVMVMVADASTTSMAVLARLYETSTETLVECGPVAPDDKLWSAMGLSPRPALRASFPMQIRSAAQPAPLVTERRVSFGSMRPLSGRVTWDGHGLPDVFVSSGNTDDGVKTDASGMFRLAHVEGDELFLRKGEREMRRRLSGEKTVVIDLKKDG